MALVKCPECGKEVSSSAGTCPHCGYTLATTADAPPNGSARTVSQPVPTQTVIERRPPRATVGNIIIGLLAAAFVILAVLWFFGILAF
ncbi:MAG: zinc ribbon domain-containing protein [Longimicrobiales bacterium]